MIHFFHEKIALIKGEARSAERARHRVLGRVLSSANGRLKRIFPNSLKLVSLETSLNGD